MTTVLLVDGSNVVHSAAWRAHVVRADSAGQLLDMIASWASRAGHDAIVVFDGAGPLGVGNTQWSPTFRVIGSGTHDGDTVIEREAEALTRGSHTYLLVTNDVAVRSVAGAAATRIVDVEQFVADITAPSDPTIGKLVATEVDISGSRLRELIDPDDRDALERMRRGES